MMTGEASNCHRGTRKIEIEGGKDGQRHNGNKAGRAD